jgi:UDP-N-acetylmuramate dehydrogenase
MRVEVRRNYPVKSLTSFKVGGSAENFYLPKTVEELVFLLERVGNPQVFGSWSNVLISSNGIKGDIIATQNLKDIKVDGTKVIAQSGVKGPAISRAVADFGLTGFEFMSGFPGSIGGNIYMNAGANQQCISDTLIKIRVFDLESKKIFELKKEDLEFDYRSSLLQRKNYIVLDAEFELSKKDKTEVLKKIQDNLKFRAEHQPNLSKPNAGSVFKNPQSASAGKLLDEAGAKEFFHNSAKVWANHANFIVNYDKNATSVDILELMYKMYKAVDEKFGIKLHPEVKYFGVKTPREEEICNILYNQN